jgi:hypothetical protein
MIKLNHSRLFSQAFRTALLFVASFLIYEILIRLEKIWNQANPDNQLYHFYKRKTYKLILIFIIDLLILYGLAIFLNIHH